MYIVLKIVFALTINTYIDTKTQRYDDTKNVFFFTSQRPLESTLCQVSVVRLPV